MCTGDELQKHNSTPTLCAVYILKNVQPVIEEQLPTKYRSTLPYLTCMAPQPCGFCGPMDKAPVYGTGDSRFDPWQNQNFCPFVCPCSLPVAEGPSTGRIGSIPGRIKIFVLLCPCSLPGFYSVLFGGSLVSWSVTRRFSGSLGFLFIYFFDGPSHHGCWSKKKTHGTLCRRRPPHRATPTHPEVRGRAQQ